MARLRRTSRGGIRLAATLLFQAVVLPHAADRLDFRVSKARFSRGYHMVRLSVIGRRGMNISAPWPFSWNSPFVHRWTSKTLHTKVLEVGPQGRFLSIGGQSIHLRLPAPGRGVTGLFVSDPCISGMGGLACPNGRRFQVLDHLSRIVNRLVGSDEFHFWGLLGNNFHDQWGDVSSEFFARLSPAAKSKLFLTVAGNHDFWIGGGPVGSQSDELGYGFMQFYGQDTVAAKGNIPYDFSGKPGLLQIAKADNFIFGTQIGDLAIFGYSGAHPWSETFPHAKAFCQFVGRTNSVYTVLVLGHWNKVNMGCRPGMDVPSVYKRIKHMEGCRLKRALYFMGHEHCNKVAEKTTGPLDAVGFMLGGTGMYGNGCSQFGFTVVQSDPHTQGGPNVRVDHFPLAEDPSFGADPGKALDIFDKVYSCLNVSGYSGCRERHAFSFRAMSRDAILRPPHHRKSKNANSSSTTLTATSADSGASFVSPVGPHFNINYLIGGLSFAIVGGTAFLVTQLLRAGSHRSSKARGKGDSSSFKLITAQGENEDNNVRALRPSSSGSPRSSSSGKRSQSDRPSHSSRPSSVVRVSQGSHRTEGGRPNYSVLTSDISPLPPPPPVTSVPEEDEDEDGAEEELAQKSQKPETEAQQSPRETRTSTPPAKTAGRDPPSGSDSGTFQLQEPRSLDGALREGEQQKCCALQ